jgi:putative Holliday junction resolvase
VPSRYWRFAVPDPTHRSGRTCGLDPGSARVGLAIDDELGLLAHPRGTLDAKDPIALVRDLREWADREDVVRFVIGLPMDLRGTEGPAARAARAFAKRVANATGRPVEMWDERLTTVQAQRGLEEGGLRGRKARAHIDEAAACTILQSWMDAHRAP